MTTSGPKSLPNGQHVVDHVVRADLAEDPRKEVVMDSLGCQSVSGGTTGSA